MWKCDEEWDWNEAVTELKMTPSLMQAFQERDKNDGIYLLQNEMLDFKEGLKGIFYAAVLHWNIAFVPLVWMYQTQGPRVKQKLPSGLPMRPHPL